ncbi:MAG: zinc metallopeptidase [Treponema sp.]
MFYFDYYYVVLVVPALILSLIAQLKVKTTFEKYSRIPTHSGITGREMAERLMLSSDVRGVKVSMIQGSLTDHYDPSSKVLRLSESVYGRTSVAAVGVAAHEMGHAIQDKVGYGPLVLRSTLVPVANIGSSFGPILAFAGLFFRFALLTNIGIILFAGAVLFYFITLPVEIDASKRALKILENSHTLTREEISGVRAVLTAAAFTYIASALTALASLLRLILLSRDRRN